RPDVPDEPRRRRVRLWPRTVRVRLTVAATLVFAVAFAAAAFGLVRLVHNNLVDRINETNQQQLDALQAAVRENVPSLPRDAPNAYCYVAIDNQVHCRPTPPQNNGIAAQREIQTTAGNITLVAQQSLASVNTTVDNVTTVMWIAVPLLV